MTHWIGIAIIVVPVLLVAALLLKRPVWWFLVALTVIGLGYLHYTGAAVEIGNHIVSELNNVVPTGLEPTPAATPPQ